MSGLTGIEWTDATWNPLRGCSELSPGCMWCYAPVVAWRFSGPGQPYEGLVKKLPNGKIVWTGRVRAVPEKLDEPLRWRKPRRIFVNSMSDLFHDDTPGEFIAATFAVMGIASHHTFQVLTKRTGRMAELVSGLSWDDCLSALCLQYPGSLDLDFAKPTWPLPNVWLGTSAEDQARADERIPHLLATPAAVRFLSMEPLLSSVDLTPWLSPPEFPEGRYVSGPGKPVYSYREVDETTDEIGPVIVDWVICGGESGHGARPCEPEWIRSIRDQCQSAGVPVFVKQMGSHWASAAQAAAVAEWESRRDSDAPEWAGPQPKIDRKGGDWSEWPADLRVREFPVIAEDDGDSCPDLFSHVHGWGRKEDR